MLQFLANDDIFLQYLYIFLHLSEDKAKNQIISEM